MDIKQEDLIRFWTWCGWELKQEDVIDASKTKVTIKSAWRNGIETQFPDLDLNSLYCYAIPKLQKANYMLYFNAYTEKGFYIAIEQTLKDTKWYQDTWKSIVEFDTDAADPTNDLYNAILKVIDNEVK
jgi:hypothetical protein